MNNIEAIKNKFGYENQRRAIKDTPIRRCNPVSNQLTTIPTHQLKNLLKPTKKILNKARTIINGQKNYRIVTKYDLIIDHKPSQNRKFFYIVIKLLALSKLVLVNF